MTDYERIILLISVVRRGRGDRVVELARGAGAAGSTVLIGKGTAENRIMAMLGLGDTDKELVFTIAPASLMTRIIETLRAAPDLCKNIPGIGLTIDVTTFLRSGTGQIPARERLEENAMAFEHKLVCVIANAGYAYEIMAAARAAGASGGTILKARGTGSEADGSFFGITIVPEKDMLLILCKNADAGKIMTAVSNCDFLKEPGTGIVFAMPVLDFFPLGQKAKGASFDN